MHGSVPTDFRDDEWRQERGQFCRDLPLSVICVILGLPDGDHYRFKNWLGALKDTANLWAVVGAVLRVVKVIRYLRRVSRPGGGAEPDGLIAALRDTEIEGRRLTEDELVSMIFLLFGAGQETTTHLLSGGLLEVLRHPDRRRRLQDNLSDMPLCVQECLRHVSPVQLTKPRWAARDTILEDTSLSAAKVSPPFFPRQIVIRKSSPTRIDSMSVAGRTRISRSGPVTASALGFSLPARKHRLPSRECWLDPNIRLAVAPTDIVWRRRVGIRALTSLPVLLT
jgi:hypothetical protein